MDANYNKQRRSNDIGGTTRDGGSTEDPLRVQATGEVKAGDTKSADTQSSNTQSADTQSANTKSADTTTDNAEIGDVTNRGTLRIKNMVCDRCIMTVDEVLRDHGFRVDQISLGVVVIAPKPDTDSLGAIEQDLEARGFSLARDHREQMVSAIKSELITYLRLIEARQEPPLLSEYLSAKMHRSYPTLSRAFTASEGHTIEQHLIRLRTERVKELLSFGEHTLSEIAFQVGYSSVQHLSAQFKKVTGKSVSEYKKERGSSRQKLDAIQ